MFLAKKVKRFIGSHIGNNPEAGRQMITGECKVELIPQGTFVVRIRCGGFVLGGVLTKTGLGTVVKKANILLMLTVRSICWKLYSR